MSLRPLHGEGRIVARDDRAEALYATSWLGASVTLDHRRWACSDAELTWVAPRHVVVLTERGGTSGTRIRCGGEVVYDGRDRAGVITFVPADVDRRGSYCDVDLLYSALWIDPALEISGCKRLAELPVLVNRSDPVIRTLLESLRVELEAGRKPDTAYVEHLVALVASRIATLAGEEPRPVRHGSLSRRAVARVADYVEANMATDISLSGLAGLVGMPVDTFARRFKAATGLAPYAYVIDRRIRRAEALLRASDMPIGAMAHALGFSSQSHFTTTFRRVAGTTPQAYRAHFFPES